jgi:putative resolvase
MRTSRAVEQQSLSSVTVH